MYDEYTDVIIIIRGHASVEFCLLENVPHVQRFHDNIVFFIVYFNVSNFSLVLWCVVNIVK